MAVVNQATEPTSQSRGNMKARTFVLTAALCFIGVGVCFAQNPFMGTWKLNEAKSTLAPGMPKNNEVVYEPEGIDVKVTREIRRITSGRASSTANTIPSRATSRTARPAQAWCQAWRAVCLAMTPLFFSSGFALSLMP